VVERAKLVKWGKMQNCKIVKIAIKKFFEAGTYMTVQLFAAAIAIVRSAGVGTLPIA
jgi:hypothetical protein